MPRQAGDETPAPARRRGAGAGGVSRASFVSGALRELSVGLVSGNFWMYPALAGMLARASGSSFRPGLSQPSDDCVME
jgi:hypothetical protein